MLKNNNFYSIVIQKQLKLSLFFITFLLFFLASSASQAIQLFELSEQEAQVSFIHKETNTSQNTFLEPDLINISTKLFPKNLDVGTQGSLFFILEVINKTSSPNISNEKFCLDANHKLIPWNGQNEQLVSRTGIKVLSSEEIIEESNLLLAGLSGTYSISIGYSRQGSNELYLSQAYYFSVNNGGELVLDSVSANNLIPYAPVQLNVHGSALSLSNNWKVIFTDHNDPFSGSDNSITINVPGTEVSVKNGVISTFLPNISGRVSVKLDNGGGIESNTIYILIASPVTPLPTEIEQAQHLLLTKLDTLIAQAKSRLVGLTVEQQVSLNTKILELQALREIISIILEEMPQAELEELTLLVLNSTLFSETQANSAIINDSYLQTNFVNSDRYNQILEARMHIKYNNKYSEILNFGSASLITSSSPLLSAVLTLSSLSLTVEKATYAQVPSLLSSFSVDLQPPIEGIYRDTDIAVDFKGTFVAINTTSGAIFTALNELFYMFIEIPALKKTNLLKKLADIPFEDSFIFDIVKEMFSDRFATETKTIAKALGLNEGVEIWSDVLFNIEDFKYKVQIPDNSSEWDDVNYGLYVDIEKIGKTKVIWTIMDDLDPENIKITMNISLFEIQNHLTELINSPACTLNSSGLCTFDVQLTDEDDNEYSVYSVVSEQGVFGQATQSAASSVAGDIITNVYQYAYDGRPVAEDIELNVEAGGQLLIFFDIKDENGHDSVVMEYGDGWDAQTFEVPVNIADVTKDTSAVTYHIDSSPSQGSLDPVIDNFVRYTASPSAEGEDSFTYYANRSGHSSELAQVKINIGKPVISTSSTINFGEVPVGDSKTLSFNIANISPATAILKIESISSSKPAQFNVSSLSSHIAIGSSRSVNVTFTPDKAGNFNAYLKITSNCAQGKSCINGKSITIVNVSGKGTTECNNLSQSGGDDPETHTISMGSNSGTFNFSYDTYSVKDRIVVVHDGNMLFNTGCVGASGSIAVSYSGSSEFITVSARPNCDGNSSGTAWNFSVSCPSN